MAWGFPSLPELILRLEQKITEDYKRLLRDILKEEIEVGWRANWGKTTTELNIFMTQMKSDLSEVHKLQAEGKLNRGHLNLLEDIDYKLSLLDKAEQQFRRIDPRLSKDIREIIANMTAVVKMLMKVIEKST